MNHPENLRSGLKSMLSLAPCTQEHLCKCFRKYLGVSPTEFINEQRIKTAAKQIVETDAKNPLNRTRIWLQKPEPVL